MKRHSFLFFVFALCVIKLYIPSKIDSVDIPIVTQNNKFGVHILFPSEIESAAKLVNSSGGDWGYVTIPIPAGDKDLVKWQKFMDDAKRLHIIPIIRLTTEGDYFIEATWKKPSSADVLDFANFLNSLDWPTLNRYVVVFNEPNRADEWGGIPDASEYANILGYAVSTFKSKSQDFFIISAGLDNASANIQAQSIDEYTFMQRMESNVPGIFNQIDAIASHSYPNPGFAQPSWVLTRKSISSFIYEKRLADVLGNKNLPVFITETGWSKDVVLETQIASYFTNAFESVWSDTNIVGITPFLLNAGIGPFAKFSLLNNDGTASQVYNTLKNIPKIKGDPKLAEDKTVHDTSVLKDTTLPVKNFSTDQDFKKDSLIKSKITEGVKFVKWLLRL